MQTCLYSDHGIPGYSLPSDGSMRYRVFIEKVISEKPDKQNVGPPVCDTVF